MYNNISKWANANQGVLAVFSIIVTIIIATINFSLPASTGLLFGAFGWLKAILSIQLNIGGLLIMLLTYLIVKYGWQYLRRQEISILSASYQSVGDAKKVIDMTDRMREIIKHGILTFHVTNEMAGIDPDPGKPKQLALRYKIGRKEISFTTAEYGFVNILKPNFLD